MENLSYPETLKIMELVAEIAAAAAGNEKFSRGVEDIDKLVKTLFTTMCKLLENMRTSEKAN